MDFLLNPIFIYALVFLAIVLPVLFWKREESVRIDTYGPGGEHLSAFYRFLWSPASLFEFPIGIPLSRVFAAKSLKYEKLILASGLPLTPAKVFTLQALSCMGAAAIAMAFTGLLVALFPDFKLAWGCLIAAFLVFVGWVYPSMTLESYVQWRKGELTRSLPFAIDLIGSAMRSGLEFGAAMRYFTGLGIPGPLTEEFGTVLQQIELGKTRTEALSDMAARVQVEEFTSFVGVVSYGTEIGASIAETLKIHGEELRRARFHLAERKAARAPSLMILPMAVFIMPAVFIIIITPIIIRMKGTGIGGH